jgi:hypothetical protein
VHCTGSTPLVLLTLSLAISGVMALLRSRKNWVVATLSEASLYSASTRSYFVRDRPNPVVVRQTARRAVTLSTVALDVQCWERRIERTRDRSGREKSETVTRSIYQRTLQVAAEQTLKAGETLLASGRLVFPSTAKLSSPPRAPLPIHYWTAKITTQIAGFPPYTREITIELRAAP